MSYRSGNKIHSGSYKWRLARFEGMAGSQPEHATAGEFHSELTVARNLRQKFTRVLDNAIGAFIHNQRYERRDGFDHNFVAAPDSKRTSITDQCGIARMQ